MTRLTHAAAAAFVAGAVACAGSAADAQAQWPSRNIDVIIPSGPGGGFDVYARILGQMMEKHVNVNIVPRNVTGGGGLRGAETAFNAPADGYSFAVYNIPGVIEPVIRGEQVGFDLDRIDWLGSMAFGQYVVVVAADSPYHTMQDLAAAGDVAFTGYGSSGIAANRILCSEAGMSECTIITGYQTNTEALLGVVRGDAEASVTPISTAIAFNTNNDLRGILLMSDDPDPHFPDTPGATEAGLPAVASLGLVRAFALPPGVDPAIRAQFQELFDTALADPDLVAWGESTGSPFQPMSSEDLAKLIAAQTALLTQYRDVIAAEN